MRCFRLIIVLFFGGISLVDAQENISYFQWKEKKYVDYVQSDKTMGLYMVDTIRINNFVILQTLPDLREYLMSESFYNKHRKNFSSSNISKYFLEYPNDFYLFDYPLPGIIFPVFIQNHLFEENRVFDNRKILVEKKKYLIYRFNILPEYFVVFLVRGDTYNKITGVNIIDAYYGLTKFKEPHAYYKWVIPIWKENVNNQ